MKRTLLTLIVLTLINLGLLTFSAPGSLADGSSASCSITCDNGTEASCEISCPDADCTCTCSTHEESTECDWCGASCSDGSDDIHHCPRKT
jgi:hypothetical protein